MIEIQPVETLTAEVAAPPSKSYTNRALVVAALADGVCRLENPLVSDDTFYMKRALGEFGVQVDEDADGLTVHGTGGKLRAPQNEIFVGNAGTAMRFLTTFAALAPGEAVLTGDERMRERPIEDLLQALRTMGVAAESINDDACPPIRISGGSVPGGSVDLPGDKSSQYLTSLMLAAPYFKNDTAVNILGDLASKSYIDITLDVMRAFGASVENESYQRFTVRAGKSYQARTYAVEGDASSASYFFAAAAVCGGSVGVSRLNPDSVQGDMGFLGALEQMGCKVEKNPEKITVQGYPLKGISINMNSMPDAVQSLAVVALFAEGKTEITGIANLRIKETDRIAALQTELTRLGARVEAGDDFLVVHPAKTYSGAEIETYNDHRMAMCFAVAGLKIPGVKIKNPECVNKSFPDFFERLQKFY